MKKIIFFLVFLLACPVWASTNMEDADNAYMQENYQEAAELYEQALQSGANADVYYNLGNTYYRLKDMGRAVLNYERALLLDPANEDIQYNLDICKSKLSDQFNKPSEMFFITWLKDVVFSKNADEWGTLGIIFFILVFLFWGAFRYGRSIVVKKTGFFIALLFFVTAILMNVAAFFSYFAYADDNRAVIIVESSFYKGSNDKDAPLRMLNPGTTVEVMQENSKGWWEVILPNGKKGWIEQDRALKIIE